MEYALSADARTRLRMPLDAEIQEMMSTVEYSVRAQTLAPAGANDDTQLSVLRAECMAVLLALQQGLHELEAAGRFGPRIDGFPCVYAAYQLNGLQRLLSLWGRLQTAEVRRSVLRSGVDACQWYDTPACNALKQQLSAGLVGTSDLSSLDAATLAGATRTALNSIPLQFPEVTAPKLQRLLSALAVAAGGISEKYEPPMVVPLQLWRSGASGDSDSDGDATLGVVAARAPIRRARGPDLVNPRPVPRAPLGVRPAAAAEPAAARTAPAPRAPAPRAAANPPCQSRYHATYAPAEKHASSSCAFCACCHLMEFLFNGCKKDCAWKHAPTARKLAMHLGAHPEVLRLARTRFDALARGEALEPVDVPLRAETAPVDVDADLDS